MIEIKKEDKIKPEKWRKKKKHTEDTSTTPEPHPQASS
jgi:hypothetical protein